MLSASPSLTEVTTFQAARPFDIRSSVAKRRATSNGSKLEVEQVDPWQSYPDAQLSRPHANAVYHHAWIHLDPADAVFDRVRVVVAVAVGHRQAVVEEGHMEFARFEDAPDLLVIIRRHGVVARFRMAPRRRQ